MIVLEKLRSFGAKSEGWHYGEGTEFSRAVIESAEAVVLCGQLLGFDEMDVFPGISGEVLVTCYRFGHCIEIEVDVQSGQRFAVSLERPAGEQTEPAWFENLEQVKNELERLKDSMCPPTFEYSRPSTSTREEIGSLIWPLGPQAVSEVAEYRSLTMTAPGELRKLPVPISPSGIETCLGSQPSSGGSQGSSYPMAAFV